jgi:hypothetical protein
MMTESMIIATGSSRVRPAGYLYWFLFRIACAVQNRIILETRSTAESITLEITDKEFERIDAIILIKNKH